MVFILIDPKVKSLVIFNAGGGIVEREMKISINKGTNDFQIQNVLASFDPNSADIKLEYINPEDREYISFQQTIVSLPDKNNTQQVIVREKSAANSIISYSIDFTREMREKISSICEASSYRSYFDMTGTFNFIINAKREGEIIVKILYFINDRRIKWDTTLQVNINEDGKTAETEGFIVVDNRTGFSYDNAELGFAIFELPIPKDYVDGVPYAPQPPAIQAESINALRDEMLGELQSMKPMKRTQRFKQLK
jgi:hypothetical protein